MIKKIISLIALVLVLACIIIFTKKDPISTTPVPSVNEARYTNKELGFSFSIPTGWHLGENNPTSSYMQIFNYDVAQADGKEIFPQGYNKIEMNVMKASEVVATKEDDEDISQYKFRHIPLADGINVLRVIMYGDKKNFYILDEFVKTIKTD